MALTWPSVCKGILLLFWSQVLAKEGWDSAMMRRCRLAFFGRVSMPWPAVACSAFVSALNRVTVKVR